VESEGLDKAFMEESLLFLIGCRESGRRRGEGFGDHRLENPAITLGIGVGHLRRAAVWWQRLDLRETRPVRVVGQSPQ
jgi:hypothetical protein